MSSRSLAAARSRRAGETAPPVSGNRPGTSIGSHAAFSPQQQMPQGYNHNMQPNNVRAGRGPPQQQNYQQQQQQQQNGLPFTKLSISDAIGLITLRLGRVEQWVIETDHENEINNQGLSQQTNLPENSRVIDNSVFASIINRLESIEKLESGTNNEEVNKLSQDVIKLNEQLSKIVDEGVKHNLSISKHNEQLFRFERELVETKDILKTFMIKYDLFTSETNNKFSDFECALTELEKNVLDNPNCLEIQNEGTQINDIDADINDNNNENNNVFMTVDLKNIIKQELASST